MTYSYIRCVVDGAWLTVTWRLAEHRVLGWWRGRLEGVMPRPILVGECNPYGGDPAFALYPAPDGCSGHRLCCLILGMSRKDYLERFERRNLCVGAWRMREAKKSAEHILANAAGPLVLCGSKVAAAFGVPFEPFSVFDYGVKIAVLPHPSGLCRLWNEPGAFEKARECVQKLTGAVEQARRVAGCEDETKVEVLNDAG